MFLIVDLTIIAILVISIFTGYRRGLAGCIIKILSFILALLISLILFKPVSHFVVTNTQIDEKIKESVTQVFLNQEPEKEIKNEVVKDQENETTLAKPIMNYMNEQVENSTAQVKKDAVNAAAEQISLIIVDIGVIILLFFVARILLTFVKAITDLITRLPIIKQFDKAGGIIFGGIQGLLIVFVVLAIITFIAPIIANYTITTLIGQSYLGNILYNNNLLLNIIF